jgi:hypothetical protein
MPIHCATMRCLPPLPAPHATAGFHAAGCASDPGRSPAATARTHPRPQPARPRRCSGLSWLGFGRFPARPAEAGAAAVIGAAWALLDGTLEAGPATRVDHDGGLTPSVTPSLHRPLLHPRDRARHAVTRPVTPSLWGGSGPAAPSAAVQILPALHLHWACRPGWPAPMLQSAPLGEAPVTPAQYAGRSALERRLLRPSWPC